jgi:hypothetical protein
MATTTMTCDLVVLGGGGCGLVAAAKAADLSGKKVIVLEKAKKVGGATTFAHGFGVRDSKWKAASGQIASESQDISGQLFDWALSKGASDKWFTLATANSGIPMMGGGGIAMLERMDPYKKHPDGSIGPGWWGTYMVESMVEICKKLNVPILTGTRAKEFLFDANGKITGVLAETKDGQLQVNCKACFIGAGGFAANETMAKKVNPEHFNGKPMHRFCPSTDEGDCILMAAKAGAFTDLSNAYILVGGPAHHPYSYSIYRIMRQPEVVTVDLNGKRYYDETGELLNGYTELGKHPRAESYGIADSDVVEMCGKRLIASPPEPSDLPVLNRFREEIAYEVALDEGGSKGNHVKKADTLSELALKMDIDPVAFVATIEKYNEFCAKGKDEEFGKAAASLKPVSKPPFYAFWGQRFSETSHGGIAVNDNGEVYDKNGKIIPGLFAGGDGTTIFGSRRGMRGGGPPSGGPPGQGGAPGAAPGGAAGGRGAAQAGAPGASGPGQGGAPGGAPGAGGGPPLGGMGSRGGTGEAAHPVLGVGSPGGGLSAALTSGYQGGITAGNYVKNL